MKGNVQILARAIPYRVSKVGQCGVLPLVGLLRKGISAFPEVKSSWPRVLGDSTSIAVFNNAERAASSPNPVPLVNGVPVMRDALSSETERVEITHPLIVNSYYSIILCSENV